MLFTICLLATSLTHPVRVDTLSASDTLSIEIGSPLLDGSVYKPHAARVRVRAAAGDGPVLNEWTNELTLGDSAGHRIMRWVTRYYPPSAGGRETGVLYQTYDLRTLQPYSYLNVNSVTGARIQLWIADGKVTGTSRAASDAAETPISRVVPRIGYMASASDLVPAAVGFVKGRVVVAPIWGPNMATAETRIFTFIDEMPVDVEGTRVIAWKVEERRESDRVHLADWYLLDRSPYMVYGVAYLPNGQVRHYSEVEIPMSGAAR
ncbi:MAG: hypothetical protein ACT4OZ_08690 [Gemmatimonadota bacterium]